jgi:synaptobrevin family protein YKT6
MRILCIHVYRWLDDSSFLLAASHELNFAGYFERKVIREHLNFASRTVTNRSQPGDRSAVHLEQNAGIAYVAVHPNTLAVTVITDLEYPQRVAFGLIAEVLNDFQQMAINLEEITKDTAVRYPKLDEFLARY